MFKSKFKKKDMVELSNPLRKSIHGVEIRKQPIGKYLEAVKVLEDLPSIIINECFPGEDLEGILKKFSSIDEEFFFQLINSLLVIAPQQLFKIAATILECDYDYLINEVTPNEFLDIVEAFWKLNDMENFLQRIRKKVLKSLI